MVFGTNLNDIKVGELIDENAGKFKRRLALSLVIFYIFASLFALILGMLQPYLPLDSEIMQMTQIGPALAFFLVYFIFRKDIHRFLHKSFYFNRQTAKVLIFCSILTIILFSIVIFILSSLDEPIGQINISNLSNPFFIILIGQIIGATFEEIGWRLYMQPAFEQFYTPIISGVITGLLWGLWHIHYFTLFGLLFGCAFLVFTISLSVILAILFTSISSGHLLTAGFFHFIVNIGLLLFFREEQGVLIDMLVLAGIWLISCIGIIMWLNIKKDNQKAEVSSGK